MESLKRPGYKIWCRGFLLTCTLISFPQLALSEPLMSGAVCASLLSSTGLLSRQEDHGKVILREFVSAVGLTPRGAEVLFSKSKVLKKDRFFLASESENSFQKFINKDEILRDLMIDIESSQRSDPSNQVAAYTLKGESAILEFLSLVEKGAQFIDRDIRAIIEERRPYYGGVNLAWAALPGLFAAYAAQALISWEPYSIPGSLMGALLSYMSYNSFIKTLAGEIPGLRKRYEGRFGTFRNFQFEEFKNYLLADRKERSKDWAIYQGPKREIKLEYLLDLLKSNSNLSIVNPNEIYMNSIQDRNSLTFRDLLRYLKFWPKEILPFKHPTNLTESQAQRFASLSGEIKNQEDGQDLSELLAEEELDFIFQDVKSVQTNLLYLQQSGESPSLTFFLRVYRQKKPLAPPTENTQSKNQAFRPIHWKPTWAASP